MIITLDGPSGSGKSTLARLLAERTNSFYLNSGFLYRALGYILVNNFGYDEEKLRAPEIADIQAVFDTMRYQFLSGEAKVDYQGDITSGLKSVEVSNYASLISRHQEVRKFLKEYQRNLVSAERSSVVEGRDCGSKVFKDADLKFFVVASDKVRAERLQSDQKKLGRELSHEEALKLVVKRDKRDETRQHAPLVRPEGSILLDTSDLSLEDALNRLLGFVKG